FSMTFSLMQVDQIMASAGNSRIRRHAASTGPPAGRRKARPLPTGKGRLRPASGQAPVTLLVLLAAAARAWIVAPNARNRALRRAGRAAQAGILAAERLVVIGVMVADIVQLRRLGLLGLLRRLDADRHQHPHHFGADAVEHAGKQLESLALVFLLGILLGVAAQVD